MFSHVIVFVVLSIMSVTAAYAATTPVSKPSQEQLQPGEAEKDANHSL